MRQDTELPSLWFPSPQNVSFRKSAITWRDNIYQGLLQENWANVAALVVVMGALPRNIKEHLFRTRKGKIVGQPRQISFNHPEATSFAQAYMAIFFYGFHKVTTSCTSLFSILSVVSSRDETANPCNHQPAPKPRRLWLTWSVWWFFPVPSGNT